MTAEKVTKNNLVESIQEETGYDKKIVQNVVESLIDNIKKSLLQGSTIELRGFGTFEIRHRKGKENARNPKTGESVSVEPHNIVAFRSGQELEQGVWNLKLSE